MFVYIMNINFLDLDKISRIKSNNPIIDDIQIDYSKNQVKIFPYDMILTKLFLDPYRELDINYSKPLANPSTNFVLNVSTNHSLYQYTNEGINLGNNQIYFPLFYISSLYKENDQYKEYDQEKFINDLNNIKNNEEELIRANRNKLYPKLYYIGNLLAKNGNVYRFSITEKYDMTLEEYLDKQFDNNNNLDINMTAELDRNMSIGLTHLLNTLVHEMHIIYYNINLDNCFVKIFNDYDIILKLGNLKPEEKLYITNNTPNYTNIKEATQFFYLIIFAFFLYTKYNKNFLYKIIEGTIHDNYEKIESWKDIYCDQDYHYGQTIVNHISPSEHNDYLAQTDYNERRKIINSVFDKLIPMVQKYGKLSVRQNKSKSSSFGELMNMLELAGYEGGPDDDPRGDDNFDEEGSDNSRGERTFFNNTGGKRKHFKKKYSRKRIKH